jgi:NADH:ubiquinone oxidoreductase subunit E
MPLASKLNTEPSPVTQLARYVKEGYSPESTMVIVFHEYAAFELHAREFRYYHCRKQLTRTIQVLKAFVNERGTILVTSTAYEYLARHPSVTEFSVKKIAEFYIDPRAEIEDHRIILYLVQAVCIA